MNKDQEESNYYHDKLHHLNQSTSSQHEIPHIASDTTSWLFKPMHDIAELCQTYDTEKPNFLKIAAKKYSVLQKRLEPGMEKWLSPKEKELIANTEKEYYRENWQSVIMRMLQY